MRYRGTIAIVLTLLISLTLSGQFERQAEARRSTIRSSVVSPQDHAQAQEIVQFRVNEVERQQSDQAQPTATPVGETRAPVRRHDPEPLPEEMQQPIAVGLLITFIVVIAVIMIHRVRHPRR